jgi:hypothetical protein
MFRVVAKGYDRKFDRWTDALEAANGLKAECKSLFQDVRVLAGSQEELIWIYTRMHKYPQYIGAGTYNRLARLFLIENSEGSIEE